MRPARFEVLSPAEAQQIDAASMSVLENVGLRVDLKRARDAFREAGAHVDEATRSVRIPEKLVRSAIERAPTGFTLYGADPDVQLEIGTDRVSFAALGTPTNIVDTETGQRRPTTLDDLRNHLRLIDALDHIDNSQMDIWPTDIPMTTIHVEAILAWAQNSRKSFGMGCYGSMASEDMMRMMAIAVGGKEELKRRPRFFGICSAMSPLQMIKLQLEGMFLLAEYGQPMAMSPEAMAGATAPVTLAGLLAQQNAEILAHIALAQIIAPGTPVLYGTVSTIADMATGNVALGAVETGLITAGAAQLARYYGLPSRSVGGASDAKTLDAQCMLERVSTLLPAVLAGVHFITCGGTLESTTTESHPLLVLDDVLCGVARRLARGIDVSDETIALDLIQEVGWQGDYLSQPHTARHFRQEHFLQKLLRRDGRQSWESKGSKTALDLARERVREILARHEPRELEPAVPSGRTRSLSDYRFDTKAVHAGQEPDPVTGSVTPPIHMTTTFKLPQPGPELMDALFLKGDRPPHVYTRWSNPSLRTLEEKMAALEGAEAGVAFASGMAVVSGVLLTFLGAGDHVVASDVCYASDVEAVRAALRPETKLVYVETPANPILRLTDIAAVADIAHRGGARLVVDSTFATPVLQKPLSLGADLVLHSMTKYLGGHGDALGGIALGAREATDEIRQGMLIHLGGAMSPFNAWLINRGLATLSLRMRKHQESALTVARFLEQHPGVGRVIYPGLASHPQHDLATRQMSGPGGMVVAQVDLEAAMNIVQRVRVFTYATSLGDYQSLLFYYPTDLYVDGATYLGDDQKRAIREWTGDGIMRLSIGLEDAEDLVADLDRALVA
jgi:methionine-gamma-lyase